MIGKKKLLITGATGYIGKGVLKEFIKYNWEVNALVRDKSKGEELKSLGSDYVVGDLGDQNLLENLAKDVDAIIHCAKDDGLAADAYKKDLTCLETFMKVGNQNAESKSCSFIYTSGCLCLGEGNEIRDEFSEVLEPHLFGKWRLEHEKIILEKMKSNHSNFKTLIIRPSWVYGANTGYITKYLDVCHENRKAFIINSGQAYCNFIHIDDLSNLYYLMCISQDQGVFHGTDNHFLTYSEIANHLSNKYGYEVTEISVDEGKKLFGLSAFSQVIDQKMITKRSVSLGWIPKYQNFLESI